ncbi:MAG: cysteine hydrolase [Streptococcaceae bacterium]|jgi:nicotinamidase-related amidase|nr:cysteine hydrolase [Streptococcaceae bacterium]
MKKLLAVIDFQNDFIDGTLGMKEAVEIIPNVIKKINSYAPNERVATMDTHFEDYLQTQEGRNLPVIHCQKGTMGWKIQKDAQVEYAKIFEKSTFGSVELAQYVADEGFEQVELIGLDTDICVISNVVLIKNFAPEVKVIVDSSCCAGVTPDKHEAALEVMRSIQVEVL